MNSNLPYAVELVTASGVLYGLYVLIFERRIPHLWSRAWLVTSLVLAALIPGLEIPVWSARADVATAVTASPPAVYTTMGATGHHGIPWRTILSAVWIAGSAAILLSAARQVLKICRLHRTGTICHHDGLRILRTRERIVPFSFLDTIYIPENLVDDELGAVISHETSHIRHRHTIERIAVETLKAAMWWNPFAWLTARKLTEVEEYEADGDVISGGYDMHGYMELIFRRQTGFNPQIANSLHHSLTKKRFIMMTYKPSRYARLRILAAVPAVALLTVAFAFTTRAAEVPGQPTQDGQTPSKKLPAIALGDVTTQSEVMPTFNGGDIATFHQWLMQNIRYPAEAREKGITGNVLVQFVIEDDGSMSGIEVLQSPHQSFTDEVLRVFGTSPRWTPGTQNGVAVKTSMMLPLQFSMVDSKR